MSLHILSFVLIALLSTASSAHAEAKYSAANDNEQKIDKPAEDPRKKNYEEDNKPQGDDPVKTGDNPEIKEGLGMGAKIHCRSAFQTAIASCKKNVGDVSSAPADTSTIGGAAAAMSDAYEATGQQALRVSQACIQASESCKSTCTSLAQTHPDVQDDLYKFRVLCHRMQSSVPRRYKKAREEIDRAKEEVDEIAERAGYKEDNSPKEIAPGEGRNFDPSSIANRLAGSLNPPQPEEQAPAAQPQAAIPEKTAAQIAQEKREQERKKSLEETFSKTFEQLNRQGEKNQAIPESPVPLQGARQPSAGTSEPNEKEERAWRAARGEAGWIQEAKKRAATRNGAAAAAVYNLAVPAAHARNSRPAGNGSDATGAQFSGSSFDALQGGAQLDPQSVSARPSDLPDLKLESPSGGSGGAGGSAAGQGKIRLYGKQNLADYLPNGRHYKNRGPAGMDRNEQIRRPTVDIWQIISVRFRSRCAEGRLMDCAAHLPK